LAFQRGKGQRIYVDQAHLHGALAMVMAPNGHLLVSNSDGINPDPNQPSEIVEFTVQGKFIGELSVDPAQGGAFGLNIIQYIDDQVRFAAVDDNANTNHNLEVEHCKSDRFCPVGGEARQGGFMRKRRARENAWRALKLCFQHPKSTIRPVPDRAPSTGLALF
jgi:hypothetical protein